MRTIVPWEDGSIGRRQVPHDLWVIGQLIMRSTSSCLFMQRAGEKRAWMCFGPPFHVTPREYIRK